MSQELHMNEKIHLLSEACVGIRTELSGMKDVLGKLSSNQEELIALRERSAHMEAFQRESKEVYNKIFEGLRNLEQMRIDSRLVALEDSRKWIIITGITTFITIISGAVLATFKGVIG